MRLYNISYFLREGIHSIFTHRLMSFAAMSVITACLLLMGSFTLVATNIDRLLGDIEEKNKIVAFVEDTYTEEESRALEDDILAIPEVSSVEFMTKTEALEDFKEDFGDESELLDGLDERNPLRDRYTITLHNIEDTQKAADSLKEIEGVAKVSARSDISDKVVQVRDVVTIVCIALVLILVLVSIFIISNTVNLTMFNRREEIAIMKMIGATNGFIRFPFVIEGLLIGIAGAAVALLLQWFVYEYIVASALSGISFIPTLPFGDCVGFICAIFFGTGVIVGGVGSAITLRKFLKV
ncbi:MAG: permease-like cell division protein FtsX [Oscillospiraceae bacterium]|nr:permease-like cell division protein FtsX [Oscillospiraceae bacterium]